MAINSRFFLIGEALVLVLLLALRVAIIYQAGLIDYDAVRNWQIVNEIGHGNFTHLYHHLSPGFFLLYAVGPFFDPPLYFYPLVNALFNLGGIWLLARWCRARALLPPVAYLVFLLVVGSSFLLISTARTFSIESPSLLLFAGIFILYHRRFAVPQVRYFYQAAAGLALAITVNYKFILLLPLALVLEVWQRDHRLTARHWLRAAGLLAAVVPISVLLNALLGLRLGQYGYAYGSMFFSGDLNAANRMGWLRGDLDFYGRYLLDFEAWLLLPGILLFAWFNRQKLMRRNHVADYRIFTFWVAMG